jgi:hypothetical protein
MVARVRTSSPFALLLTQADDPPLVAAQMRLDEHLAVIRVTIYEKTRTQRKGTKAAGRGWTDAREVRRVVQDTFVLSSRQAVELIIAA